MRGMDGRVLAAFTYSSGKENPLAGWQRVDELDRGFDVWQRQVSSNDLDSKLLMYG